MTAYGLRRLVQAIPTLLGATILGFALIHLAPGDPIQFYAAQSGGMTNDDIERLRHLYGLDQPLVFQYFNWLAQLICFDLGVSFGSHQPVFQSIVSRIPATLTLTVTALAMSTLLGVTIGIMAVLKRGGILDSATRLIAVIGHAIPPSGSGWCSSSFSRSPGASFRPATSLRSGLATSTWATGCGTCFHLRWCCR
jgi:ABC-type dipeptide/oligopeptide/nickel transport system permease component